MSRAPHQKFKSEDIDGIVGARLRTRRVAFGLTQAALGALVGVSAQQVQKYESGRNRISVALLVQLAHHLDTPFAWFLGPDGDHAQQDGRDAAELLSAFRGIQGARMRTLLLRLMNEIRAHESDEQPAPAAR